MGVADRYMMLDKLTGGVTVQPDYNAVIAGVAGAPGGSTNAYPGRTTQLANGRQAYLLGVASTPMSDGEFQSFADGQAAMSYGRGGTALPTADQVLTQAKPQHKRSGILGGIESAVGDVAHGIEAPFKASLNGLDRAYDEAISQPLSTLFTVLSDGSQWKGGEWGKLLHADNWARAYHIAEHRSPAQAAFLAFMTDDVFNADQVAKATNTDAFRIGTGVLDGAFRWYLDPLTLALGGMGAARNYLNLDPEAFNAARKGLRTFIMPGQTEAVAGAEKVVDIFTKDRSAGRTFAEFDKGVEDIIDDSHAAYGLDRRSGTASDTFRVSRKSLDPLSDAVSRPQGAYFWLNKEGSSSAFFQQPDHVLDVAPKNPLRVTKVERMESAGEAALRTLLPDAKYHEFENIIYGSGEPADRIAAGLDWAKSSGVHLNPEDSAFLQADGSPASVTEAIGGLLARSKGFDAIIAGHADPRLGEFVALDHSALSQHLTGGPNDAAMALATARVQSTYFKNVTRGDTVSYLITHAANSDERLLATKALLGDGRSLAALWEHNAGLADQLDDFKRATTQIDALSGFEAAARNEGLTNLVPEKIAATETRAMDVEKKMAAWQQLDPETGGTLFGQLTQAPGQSFIAKTADGLTGTRLFQSDPMQNLVRFVATKQPRNALDVTARGADARFDNLLRYTGVFDEGERAAQRGLFMAGTEGSRWQMVQDLQEQAFHRMAEQAGLSSERAKELVDTMRDGKGLASAMTEQQRMYSANKNDIQWFRDEDGVLNGVHTPLTETQTTASAPVYNWGLIRSAMSDVRRLEDRVPGLTSALDIKSGFFNKFMDVWKPAVLLSPRIGMRNLLLDESIATASKISSVADFLSAAKTLKTQGHNLVVNEFSQLGMNAPEALRKAATKAGAIDVDTMTIDEVVQRMAENHAAKALASENTARAALGKDPLTVLEPGKLSKIVQDTEQSAADIQRATKMKALRRGAVAGAALGYAAGGMQGALIGAGVSGGLASRLAQFDRLGLHGLSVNGFDVEASIGDRSSMSEMIRQEIANRHRSPVDWLAQGEELHHKGYIGTGSWVAVPHGAPEWDGAWTRAVNLQLGQSLIARRVLEGEHADETARWLMGPEGRKITDLIPRKAGTHYNFDGARQWVDRITDEIDTLTLGDEGIKRAMLENKATPAMLRAKVGARTDLLPSVHGEHLAQTLGGGAFGKLKSAVSAGFEMMMGAPLEELSRIPFFDTVYRHDITRRMTALGDHVGELTEDGRAALSAASREVALDETKRMFYDATDRSDLHQVLRNMIPFLPAQQDHLERWARVTMDNPVFTSRMRLAWQGLDKTVDSVVDENGDHTLRFQLPEFARGLVSHSPLFKNAFDETGSIAINRQNLNMLTGGGLGFGPIAQLVASKVVEAKPELDDALKFVIPFGPNTDIKDVFSPGAYRRVNASAGDEDSRQFMNQFRMVVSSKIADMQLGKIPKINFGDPRAVTALVDQAKEETKHLFRLSAAAQFTLPVGVQFLSPYAKQIEAYHQLQAQDPSTADEKFLDQYGPDYFSLVARTTKNLEGLPATSASYTQRQKLSDLVDSYPEIGSLILGKEGTPEGAQFNMAVYEHQLSSGQRKLETPDEVVTDPQTRLGWIEFTRQMDTIDHELFDRYGTSAHSMPKDLQALKSMAIDDLAQKYPSWYADYASTDGTKWTRKIDGMKALTNDPRTKDRPEMAPLREYLKARDMISQELEILREAGRPSSLTAQANSGLNAFWNLTVSGLVEKSTDFGALYHRWLENDPITRDPTTLPQAA